MNYTDTLSHTYDDFLSPPLRLVMRNGWRCCIFFVRVAAELVTNPRDNAPTDIGVTTTNLNQQHLNDKQKLKPVVGFTVITLLSGGFGFLSLRAAIPRPSPQRI